MIVIVALPAGHMWLDEMERNKERLPHLASMGLASWQELASDMQAWAPRKTL